MLCQFKLDDLALVVIDTCHFFSFLFKVTAQMGSDVAKKIAVGGCRG